MPGEGFGVSPVRTDGKVVIAIAVQLSVKPYEACLMSAHQSDI
jgi:hypothetical protein